MFVTKNKSKFILAIITLIFLFFSFAWSLVIYDCIRDNEAIFLPFTLLFFTRQTGILSIVYCFCILLIKKNKKITSTVGAIVNANFLIVNLVAWLGINSVIGWNDDWTKLSIDVINHLILFFLTFILWLTTLSPKNFTKYNEKINPKHTILVSAGILLIFFIPNIIINFIHIGMTKPEENWTNGYFSVYGWLTNFNPSGKGKYITLLVIPLALICFSLLSIIYTRINNSYFKKRKLQSKMNIHGDALFMMHSYFCTLCIVADCATTIPIYVFQTNFFFNAIRIINLILTFIIIIYSSLLFIYIRRYINSGYFIKFFFGFITLFAFIEFVGKICMISFNNNHVIDTMSKTCIMYGFINVFLIIWSFLMINRDSLHKVNDLHKR